uniref:Uncharacterized protein n=1 Tax=Vespula pensylvanica TaxID=30213 RepID=A0A834JMZ0_VESPE|nr:hypothetical protein H0235_018258 [Vespula pensylvanica]
MVLANSGFRSNLSTFKIEKFQNILKSIPKRMQINTRTLGALKILNICDQVRTFVKEVTFERSFLLQRQGNNLAAKAKDRSRKGTKQRTRFSGDGTKSHTESQHEEIQARSGKWYGTGIRCGTIYSPWPSRIATKKVYPEKCKTPVDVAW